MKHILSFLLAIIAVIWLPFYITLSILGFVLLLIWATIHFVKHMRQSIDEAYYIALNQKFY